MRKYHINHGQPDGEGGDIEIYPSLSIFKKCPICDCELSNEKCLSCGTSWGGEI